MAGDATTTSARRGGDVRSVARAAALLACFVDADSALTLTELARRTDLNVSTAHRLLGTLCHSGLLCREAGSERFLPGPLILRLSRSSLLTDDLTEITTHLQGVVEETGESACLVVGRGAETAVLLTAVSPQPLRVDIPTGPGPALARSATGHLLLAFGDAPVDEALAAQADAPPGLRVDVLAAQFRGYAWLDDADGVGVRSVAVPVRAGRSVRAALEVRGPVDRLRDPDVVARVLSRHALAVSALPTLSAL